MFGGAQAENARAHAAAATVAVTAFRNAGVRFLQRASRLPRHGIGDHAPVSIPLLQTFDGARANPVGRRRQSHTFF